jgi:tetratricopeptide (TPR) repeat protein
MPLIKVGTAVALQNIKENSVGRWPRRGENGRLAPIAKPAFRPSFSFEPGETIFTIGSCFARHVERELSHRGFALPTRYLFESDEDFGAVGLDVLNNYGTPSIHNELAWAFDDHFDPMQCFERVRDSWVDMHLHTSIKPTSLDVLLNRRNAIGEAYRSITRCRAVIITLGLAEVWFDKLHGTYLNVAPRRSILRDSPDRYELHVLSPAECHEHLRKAMLLIERHGMAGIKVVLTVSPVPLSATYRDVDVMVANTYSKAVLRVVAEQTAAEFDFVDYFPSYESITLSERDHVWLEDNIHVAARAVEVNVGRMVAAYTRTTELDADALRDRLRELRGNSAEILGLLENRLELLDDPELAHAFADAALQAGKVDLASAALERSPLEPILAARVCMAKGDAAAALEFLSQRVPVAGTRSHYFGTKIRALLTLSRLEEAMVAANEWIAVDRATAQPYLLIARALSETDPDTATKYYVLALQRGDSQVSVIIECAEYFARIGNVAKARELVAGLEPSQPYYRRRKEYILSLITSSSDTQ